jgi:hypothetical protein
VVLVVFGILAMLAVGHVYCLLFWRKFGCFCPSGVFSRRTCTAIALFGAIDFYMKTNPVKQTHKNKATHFHVSQENVPAHHVLTAITVIRAAGQRKGLAASCRFLWMFLDMAISISH